MIANEQIEAQELQAWAEGPQTFVGYYTLLEVRGTVGRLATPHHPGTLTTWPGTVIGAIISANLYRHNLGGRFVSIKVLGTNGHTYCGRASYDNGNVVRLRRVK